MAKREVRAAKETEVKSPEPPKSEMREFGQAIKHMVDQMAKRFRNQVLDELNKSTIEKFETTDFTDSFPVQVLDKKVKYNVVRSEWIDSEGYCYDECEVRRFYDCGENEPEGLREVRISDTKERLVYRIDFVSMPASEYIQRVGITDAQTGNFARVFLKMAARVRRKLFRQFDDKRLEQIANQYTGRVNRRNASEFYSRVSKRVGISQQELEATEGLTSQINAFQLETAQWIKKMRDDTMAQWTSNTLRDMAEGKSLPEILSQFDGMIEKRNRHAEMVARTQISTFNSLVSKTRARNLGIEKAVWVTSSDERVRSSHAARDGKEFDLADGLFSSTDGKTLLPGVDYQCRCDYRMIIPGMEDA